MWRLKITDNPNQEQENMFGEDNDVEELEEQVIDAQAKMQKAKWDERRKKVIHETKVFSVFKYHYQV